MGKIESKDLKNKGGRPTNPNPKDKTENPKLGIKVKVQKHKYSNMN